MKKETNQKRRNNHMLTYKHNKERNSVTYMYVLYKGQKFAKMAKKYGFKDSF